MCYTNGIHEQKTNSHLLQRNPKHKYPDWISTIHTASLNILSDIQWMCLILNTMIPFHILVVPTESCWVYPSSLTESSRPCPDQGHVLVQNNVSNQMDASVLPTALGLWSSVGNMKHSNCPFPVKNKLRTVTILQYKDFKRGHISYKTKSTFLF